MAVRYNGIEIEWQAAQADGAAGCGICCTCVCTARGCRTQPAAAHASRPQVRYGRSQGAARIFQAVQRYIQHGVAGGGGGRTFHTTMTFFWCAGIVCPSVLSLRGQGWAVCRLFAEMRWVPRANAALTHVTHARAG